MRIGAGRQSVFNAESGQASLEYLVVGLVVIVFVCGLSALWHYASDGRMEELVETCASHSVQDLGGIADALLF